MPKDEAFEAIEENWFSVMKNYYNDMAASQSREQAKAVEANYHAAEMAYLDALEKGLAGGAAKADAALAALKIANAAVKKSREKGEAIDKLLAKATAATGKATDLVKKAGGG